jgi:hypothetical protein
MKACLLLLLILSLPASAQYEANVAEVIRTRGFVALWDFVKRTPDGRFDAHKGEGEKADLSLDALNYVREYWGEGRAATYDDFPVIDEGPFGKAVTFRAEPDNSFRPLLQVPRARLHGSGIDVKGRGRPVSLVVWLRRDAGDHAVAGIWHEGTDLKDHGTRPERVERGMRQYALFLGLAANPGASAAHVSDNGASSFGDRYARHLSVTPEVIPAGEWVAAGFVFDNRANTVTSYLNGVANEYWEENPAESRFYRWAARAWERGEYRPPRSFVRVENGRLTALKVNPYWFPHGLYAPAREAEGGPFTIGRVIHMGRSNGFAGAAGGVAVFDRALPAREMRRLARIGR